MSAKSGQLKRVSAAVSPPRQSDKSTIERLATFLDALPPGIWLHLHGEADSFASRYELWRDACSAAIEDAVIVRARSQPPAGAGRRKSGDCAKEQIEFQRWLARHSQAFRLACRGSLAGAAKKP